MRFQFRRPPQGPFLCELGTPSRLCLHSWTRKAFCEWEEDCQGRRCPGATVIPCFFHATARLL
ncbi:hypothetical protein T05_5289, partial [Trichinella murrelli]